MSAITFELLKDADPSDLDLYRRILNEAFPEGLEPWTQEMGEVLHLLSARPIDVSGRLPGMCHNWVMGGENGRRVEEWELVAVGGRWILFKRNQGRFTISYVPLHGFNDFQRAMKTGNAVFEAAIKQPEPEEDHLDALTRRVDQLTATVDVLKGSMNVLVSRSAPPTSPAPVLWGQIRDWSKATFGPGRRTKGLLEHIRRELDEVAAAPDDLVEWVDVVLLAFDGYWRHGGTPEGFLDMVRYKFKVNQARKWPPPAPDDQPNHHVKEEDWHHDPDDDAHGTPAEHPAPPAQPEGHNAPCAFCGVFSKNHCEGGCLRGDKCCGRFQEKLKGPWCWLCNEYHATAEHTRTTGLRDPCAECGTLREHHCGGGECLYGYGRCCGRFEEASK